MTEDRPTPEGLLDGEQQHASVELSEDAPSRGSIADGARRRLLGAGAALGVLIASTYVVPALHGLRPWSPDEDYIPFWNIVGRELLGQGVAAEKEQRSMAEFEALASQVARAPALPNAAPSTVMSTTAASAVPSQLSAPVKLYPPYEPHAEDDQEVAVPIEGLDRLDHYYGQLTLTELQVPGAITRGSHWGDSVLGGDGLTHAIRRQLQARFGDAGHGFHALGRYNLAYSHRGVVYADRGGWRSCEIIFKCESDGRYGYAGVSSRSSGGGTSRWRTSKEGFGSSVSRFELWYAQDPDGGRFQIKVDGEVERVVDTRSAEPGDAVETIEVPDGPHRFEVRAIGQGEARGYGVVLERDVPGAVWDELSLIGSFTQRLDYQRPEHIAWQVARRDVDLMVFMFGGNDVQRQKMDLYRTMQPYEDEYSRVIAKFRAGRPNASCLIMSLIDHGERVGKYGIQTRRIVPKLVESQRKVALEGGCAFFDTFSAMGGADSIGRWYHANPRLANPDFSHPTLAGQEVLATLFYRALMGGYVQFRKQHEGNPLPQLELPPNNAGVGRPRGEVDAAASTP